MTDKRISRDEVRKIAGLARLDLSPEEIDKAHVQLDLILETMAAIERVDVSGVEPTLQAVALPSPLRNDVVHPSLSRDEVLSAAPLSEAFGFAVPKVMEADG